VGQDVNPFWNNLIAGHCGVERITSFDASQFDTQIAAQVKDFNPAPAFPSPKEIRRTDRYSQLGVYAGWQALRDSGLQLDRVDLDEVGVFIGSGIGGLETVTEQHTILLERGPGRLSPFMIPMLISNMASGAFSMYPNLRGPNYAPVRLCHRQSRLGECGARSNGRCESHVRRRAEATVVAIGIEFLRHGSREHTQRRPRHASRPFYRERDGFVMGEGSGVLVPGLGAYKARGARIYCEFAGVATLPTRII
jgi:3-oxoacyl-[acyl-carrier-protein] synthase II